MAGGAGQARDRDALGCRKGLCGAPKALDCRTHVRLVGALPPSGQRLRGAHALASGLCSTGHDPPHDATARKSFSNLMISPDGLLEAWWIQVVVATRPM